MVKYGVVGTGYFGAELARYMKKMMVQRLRLFMIQKTRKQ